MLTRPRMAVDFQRRQPRGFISHAHADHMARHELAFCTPATAALYRHRMGPRLRVREMPYNEPLELTGSLLTALPAGHCLGSAMLLVEQESQRLLYTGDYKLGESLTAERASLPQADILVMESTFGRPGYRMPPRELVIDQLLQIVHEALAAGQTPVIHAYALGKSQEITKILTTAGVPVLQHPEVFAISQVYESQGVQLATGDADVAEYTGRPLRGHAVVTLPKSMRRFRLAGLGPTVSIALTGWAMDERTRYRLAVDHALPLSDHADFDELMQTAQQVSPSEIYVTHGPRGLVHELRSAGFNAKPLASDSQKRLFQ